MNLILFQLFFENLDYHYNQQIQFFYQLNLMQKVLIQVSLLNLIFLRFYEKTQHQMCSSFY